MKEETSNYLWAAVSVGILLGLFFNLFLIYGGNPRGMYWRIDDNKESIETIINTNDRLVMLVEGSILNRLGTFRGVDIQLNERIEKLEGKRWYGK